MEVFDRSYLKQVVKVQGGLFDDFARNNPTCDTTHFIMSYMNSKTRAAIDQGQAYVATMFPRELMDYFLKYDGYVPVPGEAMQGFMPDWIGRFYAMYQWMEKKSSAETAQLVPLPYLMASYPGLHDLELDLAVRKVAPAGMASEK